MKLPLGGAFWPPSISWDSRGGTAAPSKSNLTAAGDEVCQGAEVLAETFTMGLTIQHLDIKNVDDLHGYLLVAW